MISVEDLSSETERIYCRILEKININKLMKIVKESSENVYIILHKEEKDFCDIYIGDNNKDFGDFIAIPVPKRFAVLEPDRSYFEITLKANIVLALKGEKDFYT
uniref:Uncharacterized protein n=1 Tax=Geoglobus ahangari TaxID=113653 RepID=A0A7C3YMM1_9EURY